MDFFEKGAFFGFVIVYPRERENTVQLPIVLAAQNLFGEPCILYGAVEIGAERVVGYDTQSVTVAGGVLYSYIYFAFLTAYFRVVRYSLIIQHTANGFDERALRGRANRAAIGNERFRIFQKVA